MATVVNNPGSSNSNSGMGMILGVIVILVIVFLFFIYGLPAIQQSSTPQINVPEKIDVNIQEGGK